MDKDMKNLYGRTSAVLPFDEKSYRGLRDFSASGQNVAGTSPTEKKASPGGKPEKNNATPAKIFYNERQARTELRIEGEQMMKVGRAAYARSRDQSLSRPQRDQAEAEGQELLYGAAWRISRLMLSDPLHRGAGASVSV
jgi:hypothetical protein